jgi:zinc transport system substrate-binding protein
VQTRIVLTLVSLLLAATVLGCGAKPRTVGAGHTKVVAAFYPLAFAAEEIGGDRVTVENLTPAGTEPHDLELTPSDVRDIGAADVVLYLGRGFQPAVEKAVKARKGVSLDLLAGQSLRQGVEEGGTAIDPHVWLDPHRYGAIAARIGRALGRETAASSFADRVRALEREYARGLARCQRREIVTSHAAFGYLSQRYGLRQVSLTGLTPEAEPAPRAVRRLVDEVRRARATTVFFETLVSPKLAQTVAREAGAKTAVLDPIEGLTTAELARGASYFTVMRANLAALRMALACR